MKEVMVFNEFGICPKCGRLMGMLESVYTMYGLTPHGHYPNKVLDREKNITYACLCGYRAEMVMTPNGIYPKNYYRMDDIMITKPKKLGKVIGYVEKRERKRKK